MKITKRQLKQIIKEEITNVLEGYKGYGPRRAERERGALKRAAAKSPMGQGRAAARAGGPKKYPEGFTEEQKESFDKGYEDEKSILNDPDLN